MIIYLISFSLLLESKFIHFFDEISSTVLMWNGFDSSHHLIVPFEKVPLQYVAVSIAIHSVQFSRSVMSNSLWPHEWQHSRPPCPSPTAGVHSNSCPTSHLILCRPLLLLPSIPPSIRVSSSESTLRMRWPKYWNFSFSISPSNEHPGLISFRMDWLDLLAVQGTLKSLLQHHSSKASILRCSAFFIVQLSHPYVTTGKTIALTRRTFVGKIMSAFEYAI